MAQIKIEGNRCSIHNETDVAFLRALDSELSFMWKGAEYTKAFKEGYFRKGKRIHWDGVTRILTSDLKFPYGLLQRVKDFYKDNGKPIYITDNRTTTNVNSISILPKLKEIDKSPYPYQLQALDAAKNTDCGILRVATGGGKTLISALIAAHLGKRAIIYVIGKDLLHQIRAFYQTIFDQPIGIVGDGLCEIHDINVASVWTIGVALGMKKNIITDTANDESKVDPSKYKEIRDMLKTSKVHIIDECHLAACDTVQKISKVINPEHIYGMSASPFRDDGKEMLIECVLGSTVLDISASYLIKNDYLVRPIIKFLEVPKIRGLPKQWKSVYKQYIVENDTRNSLIIDWAEKLVDKGYQPLILYSSIAHGKYLFDEISQKVPCALLSGKDSSEARNDAKEKLEKREIKCIVASKIFDIGVDLPSLSGLIIASGGKSSVRAYQRIGRVIRKYPGKKVSAVIDFLDQARFLKDHSVFRKNIYSSEEEFDVRWPY